MIASTQRGIARHALLVHPRRWIRARSSITGLTRDGTFLIENGKITQAVKNLRFNESPIFMLNNLEAMGRPVRVSASESGSAGAGDRRAADQGARLHFHQSQRRRLMTTVETFSSMAP